MSEFALKTKLPSYLRQEQERIEKLARESGLDFFPTVYEILAYDQMNEIAAYGGFPTRYPHWRFGMDFEQLSKSYDWGLSKIYELVINNNPSYAYLLEGNSLVDQKLVMAHVCGHVDFFKNNYTFKSTDLDAPEGREPIPSGKDYDPNRRWIDKMANHGEIVRKHMARLGSSVVEEFMDSCLSIENLIDWHARFQPKRRRDDSDPDLAGEVPRLKSKSYMESFINPPEFVEEQKKKLAADRARDARRIDWGRDVLGFLLENAPLERWEYECLHVVREEASYFVPQMQTKIMNEGWASYWHSNLMTGRILDASEVVDYAERNASVMATNGSINPYKLGVELYRYVEERWNKGQFGREWELCSDLEERRHWNRHLGLGREKIFEVRKLYNDVTFIDEFLTPEFALEQKLFTYGHSSRHDRFEIESREFKAVKEKLLFQLTNGGNPSILVKDGNHRNRGELFLDHEHHGLDLRRDYAEATLASLARIWKRPVNLQTIAEGKPVVLTHDGKEMKAASPRVG
jgi:stage V sporulation protein R